jgi:hypothetical protein
MVQYGDRIGQAGIKGWEVLAPDSPPLVGISLDAASPGVTGVNVQEGPGVSGVSYASDGVTGNSYTSTAAGVLGDNQSGGIGVRGQSKGNSGVEGESIGFDGVSGISHASGHAGVSGVNRARGPDSFGVWAKGNPAGHFEGDVTVTGNVEASNCNLAGILQVFGDIWLPAGAGDLAEEFAAADPDQISAGSVVIVDDDGFLRPCEDPYDPRTIGVVAGAGEYRPGLILDHDARHSGRVPVSVLGKVYTKVDADYGEVRIGDLLTTSSTKGHAMRVGDPHRALGTMIGKALGSLSRGCGLIPILASLR